MNGGNSVTFVIFLGGFADVMTFGSQNYLDPYKVKQLKLLRNKHWLSAAIGDVAGLWIASGALKGFKGAGGAKPYSAEKANKWWEKKGYDQPPYKPGTKVEEITLPKDKKFVRVYDGDVSGKYGGWVMNAEDVKGLTPKQIQQKYALPAVPKYICDVELPKGTTVRKGIANEVPKWGKGGGVQYDLRGQQVGKFTNERPLN